MKSAQDIIAKRVSDLAATFRTQGITKAVIAVSGGIDSAVSLGLLSQAVGVANVTALLLPYQDQNMADAQEAVHWVQLPSENIVVTDITSIVDAAKQAVPTMDEIRLGNLKARARMMVVFDIAKRLGALVCGTENKSEHYLGYFTRFGDAASDIEPIATLFKTDIRMIAEHLGVPHSIQTKPPSAGLWEGQTDEMELGFTYAEADKVMAALEERGHLDFHSGLKPGVVSTSIPVEGVNEAVVKAVFDRLYASTFKLHVPYILYDIPYA